MRIRTLVVSLVTLLAAAIAGPVQAQSGAVTGIVRSAETGSPLIAAVVQVTTDNGGRLGSALTNQSGRYQIANVPVGTYTVIVSNTGYQTGRREALAITAGQTATVNFDLVTQAIDLDPVVVSASRREERALDAPARVEVVGPQLIEELPTLQPTEHLRRVAGVDIVSQGLQSSNVVARGFNNIFSGALLALTDHRIAAIPSLRVNALYMVPATNDDIERMEVVLGPGSALYGPNTANGVLHMFTRSPLTYQGNSVSVTGGERSVFQGTARTAQLIGENLGVKLSGQFFRGDEWQYTDPVEQDARAAALMTDANTRIGLRDFDTQRYTVDGRVDWRVTPAATAIFSGGRSMTTEGIELTGVGAAQIRDWAYNYVQARFNTGGLFAQAYLNTSDAGETYLLRDGAPIVDESSFWVAQIQHSVTAAPWQDFTYGADYLSTAPRTGGTIHGRFEDQDEFTEIGAFLQSETTLGRRFDLVLAGRLDRHSIVDETVFSPRAALVFKASETQTFRASYNRAYSNPGSVQLFLDLNGGPVPGDLGRLGYNIRARGTGNDGFTFQTDGGDYVFKSPFAADPTAPIVINPTNVWQLQVQSAAAAAVGRGLLSQPQAMALVQFLLPRAPGGATVFGIDPVTQAVAPFTAPQDVPGIRESNTTTYEIGYKGLIGERLLLAADVWYAEKDNFISPLVPQAGFVFINPQQVATHAAPLLGQFLAAGGVPAAAIPGLVGQLVGGLAAIPAGVVSSTDAVGGPDLLVSYRNFGDINLWGTDLSAQALIGDWTFGLATSFVSDDFFRTEGQIVTLNAPERKGSASLGYRNEDLGLNAEARVRHSSGFPVNSGVFVGIECIEPDSGSEPCVEDQTLADLTLGYQVSQIPGATLQLNIQNLFDADYRSFVGVPEIGRMAMLRLKFDF